MSAEPTPFLRAGALAETVARLGAEISADHPDGLVVVGVLKGGVCLVADLLRSITVPCVVDFFALSPYAGERARVRVLKDVDLDVRDLDVLLVEDVVDTGLSASYVLGLLEARGARRVSVCALLDRPQRRIVPLEPTYVGTVAPEDFLVGYGLDAAERYRNVPDLWVVDPSALESDRGAFDGALYPPPGYRSSPS
ncbi:MAG: phosphoribosyltransferase family protein [Actinomycetota bacterium]|nr:phosphoribosyltransferase family protein [Actinomycetota bacterium]